MATVFFSGAVSKSLRRELVEILSSNGLNHFFPSEGDAPLEHLWAVGYDFLLHVIEPGLEVKTVSAEAIVSSVKFPEKTVFVPIVNMNGVGKDGYVRAVRDIVEMNGGKVFGDLELAVLYMADSKRTSIQAKQNDKTSTAIADDECSKKLDAQKIELKMRILEAILKHPVSNTFKTNKDVMSDVDDFYQMMTESDCE